MTRLPFRRSASVRLLALALTSAVALIVMPLSALAQGGRTTVVVLHTSDYHSHAVPTTPRASRTSAGSPDSIQYLRDQKAASPNIVILSGGDTMNLGTPAWSDKYQCAEWPLFNGLRTRWPSATTSRLRLGTLRAVPRQRQVPSHERRTSSTPATSRSSSPGPSSSSGGVKLGLFALDRLRLREAHQADRPRPKAPSYADGEAIARAIIQRLREVENVDAVVQIGHRSYEDDVKLAQAVPGIDLILGTHSHRKEDLKQIPGTNTWIISPFQYIEYVSRVELTFQDHKLTNVSGGLVRMSPDRPEAPDIAEQRRRHAADLEADPKYAAPLREARHRPPSRSPTPTSAPASPSSATGSMDTVRSRRRRPGRPIHRQQLPRRHPARRRHRRGLPDRRALQEPRARPRADRRPGAAAPRLQRRAQGHRQLLPGQRRPLHHPGRQGHRRPGARRSGRLASDLAAFAPLDPAATYLVASDRLPGEDRARLQRPLQAGRSRHRHRHHRQRPDDVDLSTSSPASAALDGRIRSRSESS